MEERFESFGRPEGFFVGWVLVLLGFGGISEVGGPKLNGIEARRDGAGEL